jgi:hypothetical protein
MEEAALLLRIRVVVGSTRAAAGSLRTDDGQRARVVARGIRLLDEMAPEVERCDSSVVRESFARAGEEIAALGETERGR